MTRVTGEDAVVLHARPYRESSAIVSLLTENHGRVALVARAVRGGKRGNVLQTFNRVRVAWSGRSSLQTLTGCDLVHHAWLTGNDLAGGFYVLELVTRLLPERESTPRIYAGACWTLDHLESGSPAMDVVLRIFEKRLLEELGYGLDFTRDADSGEAIAADRAYVLHAGSGFVCTDVQGRGYPGWVLAEIATDGYRSRQARLAARRIFGQALRSLLGERPLASRRLLKRERA